VRVFPDLCTSWRTRSVVTMLTLTLLLTLPAPAAPVCDAVNAHFRGALARVWMPQSLSTAESGVTLHCRRAFRPSRLRLDLVLHRLDVLPVRLHGRDRDGGHRPAMGPRQVPPTTQGAARAHRRRGAGASRHGATTRRADEPEGGIQRAGQGSGAPAQGAAPFTDERGRCRCQCRRCVGLLRPQLPRHVEHVQRCGMTFVASAGA